MLRDRLVAHRGYQRKYPENTLLAIREAIEAGALYVETDIQLTKDLQPVLYHDEFLARVSGVEGYMYELDFVSANTLPAYEPFRLGETFRSETVTTLDTLAGFLENHPEVTSFIEIKGESIDRFGADIVHKAIERPVSTMASPVVISFNVDFIAGIREHNLAKTGIVLTNWAQLESPQILEISPDYIFTNVKLIPAGQDLSQIEPLLVVYEIDQPQQAIELFDRGADMIETFDIGGMLDSLTSHNL